MAGQYNGLQDQGFSLLGKLDWRRFTAGDSHWQVQLSDPGLDTREGTVRWGVRDRLQISASFDSQYQQRNDSGLTPFRGDSLLQLPGNWSGGRTTGDWTELAEALQPFDRSLERNNYELALETRLSPRWQLQSALRYSTRKGTGDTGAAIYSDAAAGDAVLLPAPVDHRSFDADTTLSYSGTRLHLQGSIVWSDFDNRDQSLRWHNPYIAWAGSGAGAVADDQSPTDAFSLPAVEGALSLAPDNQHGSARLAGHYLFGPRLRLQFDGSYGLTEQDQELMPYSANPGLQLEQALPRDSFSGKVATTAAKVRLQWQPHRQLELKLAYRLRDRDYRPPATATAMFPGTTRTRSGPSSPFTTPVTTCAATGSNLRRATACRTAASSA
ncbi:MtrB/PioB family outer membrane beta-barrel protein [Kineobactrum salinum]|uniref:MtrB/PioB family outer membrane beta-barrel protein n=1 Tax=Kineobactrum salinum TaxID=2708301 RepID=A0A6C0U4L8_9GAMM|nr:MtrB/PioB family outer membrane beta-barrel protein [Kineobactrum salinum]QIB66369.1 MtrB/PioB family outer membrane beta-barrel protein [Kineobactrum salinum]